MNNNWSSEDWERYRLHRCELSQRYRDEHKRLGLCMDCGRKAKENHTLCELHAELVNKRSRESYWENRRDGFKRKRIKIDNRVVHKWQLLET